MEMQSQWCLDVSYGDIVGVRRGGLEGLSGEMKIQLEDHGRIVMV